MKLKLNVMSKTKFRPKQIIWATFLMQVMASLALLVLCFYFHFRTTQLLNNQPQMQASADRSRTHIQTETDIEQLRSSALHIANASDITWSGLLKIMKDFDLFAWGIFVFSTGNAIMSAYAIYSFRDQNRPA